MKKKTIIIYTMLCIALCIGSGITAKAVEARYLACPDINCPGRMVEQQTNTVKIYDKPQHCSVHAFCETQLSYTLHEWELRCTECGYVSRSWSVYDNIHTSHSNAPD